MGATHAFSDDIAIDLGTASTLVHVRGRGILIDEPSVVAVRSRAIARDVIAVGQRAQALAAREPAGIELIRPLADGVIADFVAAGELLSHFIIRARSRLSLRKPRVLISVPGGATPAECRTVYETTLKCGARQALLVEEPVAAALGAGLPIERPAALALLDVGGGTSDLAVFASGRIFETRSLRRAGYAMDEAIIQHVRQKHGLAIGPANAERIKIEAGTALADGDGGHAEIRLRGRDGRDGRLAHAVLYPQDIAAALAPIVAAIAEFVVRAVGELPRAHASAILRDGIHLSGGGALLSGLDVELSRRCSIVFHRPTHALHAVVRGSATILDQLDDYEHLLIGV